MDAISPAFRLRSETDFREIFLFDDWRFNESAGLVYFKLLRLIFSVQCDLMCKGTITPLQLFATLRHSCPGYDVPALPELSQLCRDAIHVYAFSADLLTNWRRQNGAESAADIDPDGTNEDVLRLNIAPLREFKVTADEDDDDHWSPPTRPAYRPESLDDECDIPF